MNYKNIGIVIQARMGSSRLPGKILKPFYENLSVLDILIEKLRTNFNIPIVLATSSNKEDEVLKTVAEKYGISFYQGDEENVLSRFIEVSERYNLDTIVRVCSDNPFFQIEYLKKIILEFKSYDVDYLSFQNGFGTPVIKTHFGLFGEVVKSEALKKVAENTSETLYIEHVTNYIYTHPELFNIKLIDLPRFLSKRKDLRFTMDDQEDYELLKKLYNKYHKEFNNSIEELVSFVDKRQDYLNQMSKNIEIHSK